MPEGGGCGDRQVGGGAQWPVETTAMEPWGLLWGVSAGERTKPPQIVVTGGGFGCSLDSLRQAAYHRAWHHGCALAVWASPTFVDTRSRYIPLLLMIGLIEGFRAEIAQRRVQPPRIVTRFDVEEKIGSRLLSGHRYNDVLARSSGLRRSSPSEHCGISSRRRSC